ncbi:hypothetical protein [Streptomyces qinglanensis]|uniref:hypothetical protein n=1 Tax=Streptomyces qinglanensis TaxID=943816 RepID=UPI003D72297E
MPRKAIALAAAAAVSSVLFAAVPAAAVSPAQTRAGGPPYPYADCVKEAKRQMKGTDHAARSLCDKLVKKGWVKPPRA